jgi:serine/threonine-protein kinase RsbW
MLRLEQWPEEAIFAVQLALDEALANAIHHGNADDPTLKVDLALELYDDRIELRVADQGPGFDPKDLPDPTAVENLERPCGRGIMLIRAYMTEADIAADGRSLRMVKRRDCVRPDA